MSITQGTTCTLPLRYAKIIPDNSRVEVYFHQPRTHLKKRNDDESVYYEPILDEHDVQVATRVYVDLTQEETLMFEPGDTEVQLRYIDEEGETKASGIAIERWEKILEKGVMKYD